MKKSQNNSLNYTIRNYESYDLFNCLDGSILIKSDKYIESIGVRGGITTHLYIFNNRFKLNGVYSKQ